MTEREICYNCREEINKEAMHYFTADTYIWLINYKKLLEFVKSLNFFTIERIHDSYREGYMDRACEIAEAAEKVLKEIGELNE